jgi:hypothetical protein
MLYSGRIAVWVPVGIILGSKSSSPSSSSSSSSLTYLQVLFKERNHPDLRSSAPLSVPLTTFRLTTIHSQPICGSFLTFPGRAVCNMLGIFLVHLLNNKSNEDDTESVECHHCLYLPLLSRIRPVFGFYFQF